jgi:hypothetical protein
LVLEIGKLVSLLLSILSLDALLTSAFFVPGSHWDERLLNSLARVVLAGCVCFASGLLFNRSEPRDPKRRDPGHGNSGLGDSGATSDIMRTLPVRLFLWGLLGMALLFALSWYLEEYYIPTIWKNQPY